MHRGRARLAIGDHCRTPDDQPEAQGTIKVDQRSQFHIDHVVICKLLLRAGASIDDVHNRTDWEPDTSMEAVLQQKAQPADDEQWLAVKRLVADVRAAGGTYSAYLHQHRKQVLMLRCLATKKGRAKTTDPVMNFLVKLGDNGVIWKVLSFWPPPP